MKKLKKYEKKLIRLIFGLNNMNMKYFYNYSIIILFESKIISRSVLSHFFTKINKIVLKSKSYEYIKIYFFFNFYVIVKKIENV